MGNPFAINRKPLIGTDEATVDDKGRVLLSKKKRERLGETFALALDPRGCLVAYTDYAWEHLFAQTFQMSSLNPDLQDYLRELIREADDELKCDTQGRFVIPEKLRKAGNIQKEVWIIGLGDRMEIWGKEVWDAYQAGLPQDPQERAKLAKSKFDSIWEKQS